MSPARSIVAACAALAAFAVSIQPVFAQFTDPAVQKLFAAFREVQYSHAGDTRYQSWADFDKDGDVDTLDLLQVRQYFNCARMKALQEQNVRNGYNAKMMQHIYGRGPYTANFDFDDDKDIDSLDLFRFRMTMQKARSC